MSKMTIGLLLLVISQSALAQIDCEKAIATPDINACAQKGLDRAESKLNSTYQLILAKLQADSKKFPESGETRKQLIEAQRSWVKYREADCQAIYTLWSTGTIRNLMYIGCMQRRAEQRTKELGEYGDQDH